jgi:hypothetical protein
MLKRIAIFTVLCLAMSLWPARATGTRMDGATGRHIAGLAGHAAILGAQARVRQETRGSHQSAACAPGPACEASRIVRPALSAARSVHTLPSHRIATHLSL